MRHSQCTEHSAALTEEMIAAGQNPLESEQAFFKLLNESIERAVEANDVIYFFILLFLLRYGCVKSASWISAIWDSSMP